MKKAQGVKGWKLLPTLNFGVYQSAGKYRIMAAVADMFGNHTSQFFHAEAR